MSNEQVEKIIQSNARMLRMLLYLKAYPNNKHDITVEDMCDAINESVRLCNGEQL